MSAARPPEPLPAAAFDSHCHLEMIDRPTPDVVAEAAAAGITRMITIGTDLASRPGGRRRWPRSRGRVRAAVAIHPNSTADAAKLGKDEVLAELAALAAQPSVVAVGETGLDYYRDHAPPEVQQEWFRAHIEIAKDTGKALVIHDREAHDDVLRLLAEEGAPEQVVFHCFSGGAGAGPGLRGRGLRDELRGQRHVPQRPAAAGRRRGGARRPDPGRDRRSVPHAGAATGASRTRRPCRRTPCASSPRLKDMDIAELCAAVTATGDRVFGPWPAAPWPAAGGEPRGWGSTAQPDRRPGPGRAPRPAAGQAARAELRGRPGHRAADHRAGQAAPGRRGARGRPRVRLADPAAAGRGPRC